MTLRAITGGKPRERRETAEYKVLTGMQEARRALAIEALVQCGIGNTRARLCVHQLEAGADDAFDRAFAYVEGDVLRETFRKWCFTHGYHRATLAKSGPSTECCSWCGGAVKGRDFMGVQRLAGETFLRCGECAGKQVSVADVIEEYACDLEGLEP